MERRGNARVRHQAWRNPVENQGGVSYIDLIRQLDPSIFSLGSEFADELSITNIQALAAGLTLGESVVDVRKKELDELEIEYIVNEDIELVSVPIQSVGASEERFGLLPRTAVAADADGAINVRVGLPQRYTSFGGAGPFGDGELLLSSNRQSGGRIEAVSVNPI